MSDTVVGHIKRFEGDVCGAAPLMERRTLPALNAADETNLYSRERLKL